MSASIVDSHASCHRRNDHHDDNDSDDGQMEEEDQKEAQSCEFPPAQGQDAAERQAVVNEAARQVATAGGFRDVAAKSGGELEEKVHKPAPQVHQRSLSP